METLTIMKPQLEAALLRWEQDARAGKTLTVAESLAKPVEQVAYESAEYLWSLLTQRPQTMEDVIARALQRPMQEAICPTAQMTVGKGRAT